MNKDSNQSKIELLKSILSEVNIFATTVKNLESSLYQKEQETEAAAAEAYLEKTAEDEKQAVPVDEEDKPKMEGEEEEEESTFFKVIKNALGFIVVLLPLFFKGFDDIKKLFGELPDIMGGSFKDIVFGLFEKIQGAIDEYVFQPISDYLNNTVSELWKSLISGIEDTFSGIIGGLPEFLKADLPKLVKEIIPGAVGDFGKGEGPGAQPDIDMEGEFGTTEKPSFGGEYKPPEFGSKPSSAPAAPQSEEAAAPPPAAPPAAAPPATPPAAPPTAAAAEPPVSDIEKLTPSSQGTEQDATKEQTSATSPPSTPAVKIGEKSAKGMDDIDFALKEQGITDPVYIAAIKANIMKETGGKPIAENLRYGGTSNERIRKIFGKRAARYTDAELDEIKKDEVKMGELMYGRDTEMGQGMGNTSAGDGYKYRGRGYIQITGKKNYTAASKAIFGDDRLVKDPDLLLQSNIAAAASAWYMKEGKNEMAKRLGIDASSMSQEEANLLATSQIAGSDVRRMGAYGKELLAKVGSYSEQFAQEPTMIAESSGMTPIPPSAETGEEIKVASAATQQAREVEEEKQQEQVIIQTAMSAQPKQQMGQKAQTAGPGIKPRAESVQKSYSSYFAVA